MPAGAGGFLEPRGALPVWQVKERGCTGPQNIHTNIFFLKCKTKLFSFRYNRETRRKEGNKKCVLEHVLLSTRYTVCIQFLKNNGLSAPGLQLSLQATGPDHRRHQKHLKRNLINWLPFPPKTTHSYGGAKTKSYLKM